MHESDNGERPVREKLKNTSIAATAQGPKSPLSPSSDIAMATDDSEQIASPVKESMPPEISSLKKKRSFEDVEAADQSEEHSANSERHVRKRSRSREPEKSEDVASNDQDRPVEMSEAGTVAGHTTGIGSEPMQAASTAHPATPPAEAQVTAQDNNKGAVSSPKNKRSREEFLEDHADAKMESTSKGAKPDAKANTTGGESGDVTGTPSEEPKSKRHRDSNSPQPDEVPTQEKVETEVGTAKLPSGSTSTDASVTSPFGALSRAKSPGEQPQTSASAFAKSGFSTFAGSSSSPFGPAGTKGAETFKSAFAVTGDKPALATFGTAKPLASSAAISESKGFGSAGSADKSPFATAANTSKMASFGSGGSTFGGSGGKSASFGGSKLESGRIGLSGPILGLGTAADDEEDAEAEEGAEGDEVSAVNEEDKQDERFHIQDMNTGEDDESTRFLSRAKLYAFLAAEGSTEKTWKERGLGNIKLNVSRPDDEKPDERQKVRLIMRAEGSQRVMLNTPVLKDIKFGDVQGGKPSGQTILFRGTIDEKPELELLQLKMKPANAVELWQQITELQEDM
ncbi:MAG: hypothetical protein M1822_005071 [Bathelium mastoideum]|nr:MAG: hypothetical protein M1822_005071 [Bathelium mastoideum]